MINRTDSQNTQLPSNQRFGWFFTGVFAVVATYSYMIAWNKLAIAAFVATLLFAVISFLASQLLAPLNRFWYALGILLGKFVSPIVLGIIFFILITPVSLLTRLFGRDELKLKKKDLKSYWIDRLPPGPQSDSFKNQY